MGFGRRPPNTLGCGRCRCEPDKNGNDRLSAQVDLNATAPWDRPEVIRADVLDNGAIGLGCD